jgi:hypothetical protein
MQSPNGLKQKSARWLMYAMLRQKVEVSLEQ